MRPEITSNLEESQATQQTNSRNNVLLKSFASGAVVLGTSTDNFGMAKEEADASDSDVTVVSLYDRTLPPDEDKGYAMIEML